MVVRSEREPVEELADGIYRIDGASFDQEAMKTYEEKLFEARAWIVDLRGYPPDGALMRLAGHLVSERKKLARVSAVDLANPGAINWWSYTYVEPKAPLFDGKVAVIVDEWTQSHAEYVAMAFQASTDALIVGSTTSGANGNISRIPLPGGYSTAFSGLGIHYPDGSKTQRVGIVPSVRLEPTVEAIWDGRDDVLDRTLEEIARTIESGLQPTGDSAIGR